MSEDIQDYGVCTVHACIAYSILSLICLDVCTVNNVKYTKYNAIMEKNQCINNKVYAISIRSFFLPFTFNYKCKHLLHTPATYRIACFILYTYESKKKWSHIFVLQINNHVLCDSFQTSYTRQQA